MKYCKYCGAELSDDAAVCSRCGHSLAGGAQERNVNKLGLVGFILSFFTGPVAFILSLIGLIQGKRQNEKVGFAIAGLILSIISIIFAIIYYSVVLGPMLSELGGMLSLL